MKATIIGKNKKKEKEKKAQTFQAKEGLNFLGLQKKNRVHGPGVAHMSEPYFYFLKFS